jgi:hypothetical protein
VIGSHRDIEKLPKTEPPTLLEFAVGAVFVDPKDLVVVLAL